MDKVKIKGLGKIEIHGITELLDLSELAKYQNPKIKYNGKVYYIGARYLDFLELIELEQSEHEFEILGEF